MSYFRFVIYKALRNVLFLGFFDQRCYEGLILDVTEDLIYKTFLNQHHVLGV